MLPPHVGEMSILEDESLFEFPEPPESIPDWADTQAKDWRGLDFFDIEVRAEALSGRRVEIMRVNLPVSVWGMQISKKGRVRLCVNSALPSLWQRFALFHELYHLLSHTGGGTLLETDIAALVAIRGGGGSFRMVRHLAGVA